MIDREGTYLLVNTLAADRLGAAPEEIIGKPMSAFLPQETADQYLARNRGIIESCIAQEYVDTFELKTGKRSFLIVDQCVQDAAGRVSRSRAAV